MPASKAASEVGRHYDRLDAFYRQVWGEHMHHGLWRTGRESLEEAKLALLQTVVDAAHLSPGQRVLDLGCGYGAPARWLASERGVAVTAVTNSPAQFAYASARGGEGIDYHLGDWPAVPLPGHPFDAVIALESAEYFGDKAALFASARKSLRPGGRFVLAGWLAPRNHPARSVLRILAGVGMPPLEDAASLARIAETAGFTLGRQEDLTPGVAPTWQRMGWIFLRQALRRPALFVHLFRNLPFALAAWRITRAFRSRELQYGVGCFIAR